MTPSPTPSPQDPRGPSLPLLDDEEGLVSLGTKSGWGFGVQAESLDGHLAVIGHTGSGKSELLKHLAFGCAKADYPVVVFDPQGDLCDDLLAMLLLEWPERETEIVSLDFSDREHPPAFNPLDVRERHAIEPAVQAVLNMLALALDLSGGSSPRALNHARYATLALCEANLAINESGAECPRLNLLDLLAFYSDETLRRLVVEMSTSPIVLDNYDPERGLYELLSERQQSEQTMPLKQALSILLRMPSLNASENRVDLAQMVSEGKIVLIKTHGANFDRDVGELFVSLLLDGLWAGAEQFGRRRGGHGVRVFVDDIPRLFNPYSPLVEMVATGRRDDIGLIYSLQQLEQFDSQVERKVIGNTSSLVSFGCDPRSAELVVRRLGREFGPPEDEVGHYIPATDVIALPNYEFYAKMLLSKGRERQPAELVRLKGPTPSERRPKTRTVKELRAARADSPYLLHEGPSPDRLEGVKGALQQILVAHAESELGLTG